MTYGGVSLRIPPAWGNVAYVEAVSQTLESAGYSGPGFLQYVLFFREPHGHWRSGDIIVQPVQSAGIDLYGNTLETCAGELRAAIDTQANDYFPIDIPTFIALQVQTKYLHFENISGIRAVVSWAQDIIPLSNERLYYAFRGLDAENRYYIAVTLPLDAAGLPPLPEDCESDGQCCADYNQEVQKLLMAASESDFEPDLAALDAIVTSLRITRLSIEANE